MDFWAFCKALFSDWVSLMSGAFSVVFTIIGLLRPAANQRKIFGILAFFCSLLACARIWTTEHRAKDEADGRLDSLTRPDFRIRIDQLNLGRTEEGRTAITLEVSVRNLGAPSVIDSYQLKMDLPQYAGCTFDLFQIPPGGIVMHDLVGKPRAFPPGSALFDKAATQPIVTGGKAVGILLYLTSCIKVDSVFQNRSHLQLWITDVTGKQVLAQNPNISRGEALYYPGTIPDSKQTLEPPVN
jgi:hypothetical protein